jgi:hypothetical protein
MTDDLDEVTARLTACLHTVTEVVPDEAPPWDAHRRPDAAEPRPGTFRPSKRALAAAGAAVLGIAAVIVWQPSRAPGTVRTELIRATARTIAAQTARVRLTSVPSAALERSEHAVAMTATGAVDFATPAIKANYPDGYSWIQIGNRSWQTTWPSTSRSPTWERAPVNEEPSGTTAAGRRLERALQPDTGPGVLLAALRAGTESFVQLGDGEVEGIAVRHYRATIGSAWDAEVWVGDGKLLRVEVRTPNGSTTVDYYGFGTPMTIAPPSLGAATSRG